MAAVLTDEKCKELKAQGYVAVVVQVIAEYGRAPNDIASRHRSVGAANKRADVNQRVVVL
jgi:hypothetical protein